MEYEVMIIKTGNLLVPEEDITNGWHTVYYAELFKNKHLVKDDEEYTIHSTLSDYHRDLLRNAHKFLSSLDKDSVVHGPHVSLGRTYSVVNGGSSPVGGTQGWINYVGTYNFIRFKNKEDATYFKLTFL